MFPLLLILHALKRYVPRVRIQGVYIGPRIPRNLKIGPETPKTPLFILKDPKFWKIIPGF